MCFDKQTSIITFILGTVVNIFNIFYFRTTIITLLSIIWEWILLMQLFEAIAWDSQPSGESCSKQNNWATNGAMIANVTQPIIVALVLIAFTSVSTQNKIIAMTLVFAYICWLLYALNSNPPFKCLKPTDNCENLDLVWWNKFPGGAMPYMIVLAAVIFLLLRPMDVAWASIIFIKFIMSLSRILDSNPTNLNRMIRINFIMISHFSTYKY